MDGSAALEESMELSKRMADRARKQGRFASASLFEKRVRENGQRATLLREALYKDVETALPDSPGGE